jgi:hypothetical protein
MPNNNAKPFDQLSETDQRVAIDIACAMSVLVTRLPQLKVGDAVMTEFAHQFELPSNLAKYALRQVGQTLFKTTWEFGVSKEEDGTVSTYFKQGETVDQDGPNPN